MLRIHRSVYFLLLVTVCLNCGCGTAPRTSNPAGAATFPAVVFSDVHFNPLDTPAHDSVMRGDECRSRGPASSPLDFDAVLSCGAWSPHSDWYTK